MMLVSLAGQIVYSTAVSDVNDKLMDFCCFYHQKGHFLETSEKLVPILCHIGQKFSVLYKFLAFIAHIAVKCDGFQGCIKCAKQALFDLATSIWFVE